MVALVARTWAASDQIEESKEWNQLAREQYEMTWKVWATTAMRKMANKMTKRLLLLLLMVIMAKVSLVIDSAPTTPLWFAHP